MSSVTKKILITGGTGFVGTHLVQLLQQSADHEIHVTSYGATSESVLQMLGNVRVHKIDLTDQKATTDLLAKIQPHQIYHLASFSSVADSLGNVKKVLENNIGLQVSLLEAVSEKCPSARILIVSSAEVYGLSEDGENPISENHPLRPVNPYAVSKVTQDLLAFSYYKSKGLNIIRARPFNHSGAGQLAHFAVPSFAKQIVDIEKGAHPVLKVGNLQAIRDISHVSDVVQAYVLLMERGSVGEVYNIGTGTGVSMSQVVETLIGLSDTQITVEIDPDRLRPLDIPEMIANNEKITHLGWKPSHTLKDTLNDVLSWYRTQED
ncbi:MAG: GDP-mannose 4,6-dehydratase [Microgenomates group bacterium]